MIQFDQLEWRQVRRDHRKRLIVLRIKMPNFKPPDAFDFSTPTAWPAWQQRFLRLRSATKLSEDPGEVQVNALIYAMGPEAEDIIRQFEYAMPQPGDPVQDPTKDIDTVLAKFDSYFTPVINYTHERAVFNVRVQQEGQRVGRDIHQSPIQVIGKVQFSQCQRGNS